MPKKIAEKTLHISIWNLIIMFQVCKMLPWLSEQKLFVVPLEVMQEAEKLLYLIGKTILEAYDLYEE